jgi:hypothetical protein
MRWIPILQTETWREGEGRVTARNGREERSGPSDTAVLGND